MLIIEDEIIGSQSDDENHDQEKNTDMDDILSQFGIEKEEEKEKPIDDKPPAKEDVKTGFEKVKHNKGEEDVDISTKEKLHDHLQRSLALDKERERKTELEKNLDRAAKLAGYTDHSAYVADLDRLEQQQQQKKQTELDELREDMLSQLEANGLDRVKAEEWINNHPLIKQGTEAIAEKQKISAAQEEASRWKPLYDAFPEIDKLAKAGDYTWATPELLELAKRNDPLLAFEHLNKGKTIAQTKKATEQQVIKEQQLGLRSRVETNPAPDNEKQVPAALANAFAAFGLPAEAAKKYVK